MDGNSFLLSALLFGHCSLQRARSYLSIAEAFVTRTECPEQCKTD